MNYRDPAARDQGLDEKTICEIPASSASETLTEAEKAALRFAELLARDHRAIDQAVLDELARYFDERAIIELGWAAGAFIAFGRLIHVFGAEWAAPPVGTLKPER